MTTITEQNKHTWCVNAEHSLTGGNSGTTKVCCMYKSAESSNITLRTHSIQDNYNQEEVLELRSALGNGVQHPNCTACWQEENSGRESKRIRDNKKYLKLSTPYEGLAKVELNLGNVCNIKCRTCNVYASSQWMREQFDLYEKDKYINFKEYADKHKVLHQTYDEDSPFWNDLIDNLSSIKQFDFYGGEPFMSNKMWHILDIAVEQGYAKDIELHYNTNGTLWPEDKVQLWKHFKEVNISFSIDGIGNQFEYMRHMAKWNMVKDNMAKARAIQQEFKNMNISWCVTLSNLNIYNLPEVLDEFYANYSYFGLYLNLVHSPEYFNISNLDTRIKEVVLSRLEHIPKTYRVWQSFLPGVINFINNESKKEVWEEFKTRVVTHDEYRKEQFSQTFSEYAGVING